MRSNTLWSHAPNLMLTASMLLAGCAMERASGAELEAIELEPATLDEASASLAALQTYQDAHPNDPQVGAALDKLRESLDALNHVIARIDLPAGRAVIFFEPSPGIVGISESGPAEGERILTQELVDGSSFVALYERLAKTNAPEALVQAQARHDAAHEELSGASAEDVGGSADGEASTDEGTAFASAALTAADGPWFVENACFTGGDFRGCHPSWSNGGYAQANTKTSFFEVAPFAGNFLQVRFQYEGSTKFTDAVYPGEWRGWWYHSSKESWPCGFLIACGYEDYNRRLHRWDILQATGDSFHWTYSFKWTCGSTLSCNTWPPR